MSLEKRTIINEPSSGLWKNGENPDVFVDIFGITHCVWTAVTLSGIKRIFYIFDDGNLEFKESDLTLIGNIDRNSDHPKIAANKSGRIIIIFEVENQTNDGTDIYTASNDGSLSLSVALHTSRNNGPNLYNRRPDLVINDETKDPHFIWLGTHPVTGKTIPYYTRKNATTLIPTIHEITPDINNDCDRLDLDLMGDRNEIFVSFEQKDPARNNKTNIRLAQGNQNGFSLLGGFEDAGNKKILNRPTFDENNIFPRLSIQPRIRDIIDPEESDDDPSLIVVWEEDGPSNHIRFSQRDKTDFADGTISTSGVHRPIACINHSGIIYVAYYKTAGSNNIVNLSFKDLSSNIWTEISDVSNEHAFGDGIYNIEMVCSGNDNIYIAFKTGSTVGPQRIVHLNNFRTNSLLSFEVFTEQLNSPSDTRSAVALHIDDKIANRLLLSDADSRFAVIFSDYTVDFIEPDGIGDVHVFGGVVAPKPTIISITDEDGDNKPEFKFVMPDDHSEGFYDIYFRLCGASGIVPYQENIMLSGTYISGLDGNPEAGYLYSTEGPSGINIADLYGFGIRKKGGPWSEEFCFRLGDISISHPKIVPPQNKPIEKCDVLTLKGSAEPGSEIESQILIEYSDVDGTVEINRTIITQYEVDAQGNYSGLLPLNLLPNTRSIRTEVIARDSDGNLSDPADSVSNLIVVENEPPVLVTVELQSKVTCSRSATNSGTIDIITTINGDVCDIKFWESVQDGGTGEVGAIWMPYSPKAPFTFANMTNGTKTIYAKLRDCCGNESNVIFSQIELDTIPPQILAATFDPATRRLTISFSEPVTSLDLSKIRIVKSS